MSTNWLKVHAGIIYARSARNNVTPMLHLPDAVFVLYLTVTRYLQRMYKTLPKPLYAKKKSEIDLTRVISEAVRHDPGSDLGPPPTFATI